MGNRPFNSEDYGEYRDYLLSLNDDNSYSRNTLRKNLRRAISEELTQRQKELLIMYYIRRQTMVEIANELSLSPSSVSRTIKRGRIKLKRCIRYGAKELLSSENR